MSVRVVFDEAALRDLLESPDGDTAKHLVQVCEQVVRRAKQLAPVDTGRLRSSITYEIGADTQGLVARVGTDVVYAKFLELGTQRMTARPFLRPAIMAVVDALGR